MKLKANKDWLRSLLSNELQLALFACIGGIFTGAVVSLYNIFVAVGEQCSVAWYEAIVACPAFIPLLFLALVTGAVVIGTIIKFIPLARGSGIPQIEGAIRGGIALKGFRMLITSFALSLGCIFLGLSAGGEGPSMMLGGATGQCVGNLFKSNRRNLRYLMTGGASAGLAVAFNTPLTGFLFAFEEAHKKFTPEIFFTAFFSVTSAVLTGNGIRLLIGNYFPSVTINSALTTYNLSVIDSFEEIWSVLGIVAIGAIFAGLLGVAFYYIVILLRPLALKVNFKGIGRYVIPFVVAGAFGLISIYEMGGGKNFINAIGSNGGQSGFDVYLNFASPVVVALAVITLMKFLASALNMGFGVPCGVFIPLLATGAGIGAIVSYVAQACGMNAVYSDIVVIVVMATFFACIVKAPMTSIVMTFELTGSFNFNLIIVAMLGVAIGYTLGKAMRTEPIYDVFLEDFLKTDGVAKSGRKEKYVVRIKLGSPAEGKALYDMLLPYSTAVVSLCRDGKTDVVPSNNTVLVAGDVLTVETATDDRKRTFEELTSIAGEQTDVLADE